MTDFPLRVEQESTALAHMGAYLTVGDVLLLELPHLTEKWRIDVAWEFTGFPGFFADPHLHPTQEFRKQLREFRDGP